MEELVGRLTALDPDASASLKVIVYFDSLVDGHAGIEAFLRGAAILSGCAAGVVYPERHVRMRVDETGTRTDPAPPEAPTAWPSTSLGYADEAVVWIERDGALHANDAMVLERLAWGMRMTLERTEAHAPADASKGVEILLDPASPPGEQQRAAHRLHLDEVEAVRVIASPPADSPASHRVLSTIMATAVGPVRATLEARSKGPGLPLPTRAGVGPWVPVRELPSSWSAAVTALRFTGDDAAVVSSDELGPLAILAAGVDAQPEQIGEVAHLDAVTGATAWAAPTLEALSSHDSVRAAASALGVHHSTVQTRCEQLEELLGYSLRTQTGRNRVAMALSLQRLVHNRFD